MEASDLLASCTLGTLQKAQSIYERSCHDLRSETATHVYVHLAVQAIVGDQVVSHAHPVRLHGVTITVGKVADIAVVEVGDPALGCAIERERLHGHSWWWFEPKCRKGW